MEILGTITRFDEPAKGFLAKAAPTSPNEEQIVFVLGHLKTGFLNARLHHTRNTEFLTEQKQETGNMWSAGT